jgi:hypothetical protein
MRFKKAWYSFRHATKNEPYPYCCIIHFSLGVLFNIRNQAIRRGGIVIEKDFHKTDHSKDVIIKNAYVPCSFHKYVGGAKLRRNYGRTIHS